MIETINWTRRVQLVTTSALISVGLLAFASKADAQNGVNFDPIASNVEQASPQGGRDIPNGIPFQISVDGVPIDGSLGTAEDDQRTVDVALDRMDVQLTFDGLRLDKAANIQANKAGAKVGEEVVFTPYWNYGSFVERAEVRIFDAEASDRDRPLTVLPLPAGRSVGWTLPEGIEGDLKYVLRLYNKNNRFDETIAHRLQLFADDHGQEDNAPVQQAGYGQSSLAKSNIAVGGGTVTVFGENVPPNSTVYVLGLPVPVDSKGKFVTEQLLPAGSHNVTIAVLDDNRRGLEFQRNLYIPDSDFFYVALGDLTVGASSVSGPTELVGENGGFGENFYTNARLAGFLKGKAFGDVYVTAQADTGEASVQEIFTGILDKDPTSLIDRIDDNRTYTTFGDDSSITDETPSQGKFFVKVEKGNSHVMWGNFSTSITGTEFANVNRSLYGAQLKFRSEQANSNGDAYLSVDAFASQQGTVPHRDEFRGTGNSVYFMSFQDLAVGGERLTVEIRDPFNNIVKERRELLYGEDYDIDYIQGRVILFEPLPSTVDDGFLVSYGTGTSGDEVYLVSEYEYSPIGADFSDLFYGGRASAWVGKYFNIGATAVQDQRGLIDKQLLEADATLAYGGSTYLRAEVAQTKGDPYVTFGSLDGGYFVDPGRSPAQVQTLIPNGGTLSIVGDLTNLEDLSVTIVSRDPVSGEQTGSKTLAQGSDFTLTGNALELTGSFAGWDATISGAEGAAIGSGTQIGDEVEVVVNPNNGLQGENGYRFEASVAAADFGMDFGGRANAYYQHRDAGFAGIGSYTADEVNQLGGSVSAPVGPVTVSARYDQTNNLTQDSQDRRANLDANAKFGILSAGLGLGYSDSEASGVQTAQSTTLGGDIGAALGDYSIGLFGQYDLQNSSGVNKGRVGVRGSAQINEHIKLNAQVGTSFDNGGESSFADNAFASIGTDVTVNDYLRFNAAYELANRTNAGTGEGQVGGTLNFGANARFKNGVDFHFSESIAHQGTSVNSLQHAFGVNYVASKSLSFGVSAELGQVRENQFAEAGEDNPFLNRRAATVRANYGRDGLTLGGAAEYRWEESSEDVNEDGQYDTRTTYVLKGNAGASVSPSWRLVANAAAVFSEHNGNFEDGNFLEASVGAAYRPIDNDRLNFLVRATALYDLPTFTQAETAEETGAGVANYRQRSMIGEADAIFQLTRNFDLGAKYGVKVGEVTSCRACTDWYGSNIHLLVGRVDWHVVKNWDALLEGRVMWQGNVGNTGSDAIRYGALAAVYRHVGDNLKIGGGYNFGSFDDNLTNVSFDKQGLFVNAIAKF
jgi:hypothetical protein